MGNATAIEQGAGCNECIMLNDTRVICFFSYQFKAIYNRGQDSGIFKLSINNKTIVQVAPYIFPCFNETTGVVFMVFKQANDTGYFVVNKPWNANEYIRVSGAFTGILT